MKEKYYILRLWDYATPSFVSFDKVYVGTENEIRAAIASMKEYEETPSATVEAVEKYLSGDKTATHNIAYQEIPALEPCKFICSSVLTIGKKQWEHTNTWGCPYIMRCDSAEVKQIIVKYQRKYYRCHRTTFHNLRYESVMGRWSLMGDFYLGPCYLFDVSRRKGKPRTMNNLLYVVEEIYDTLEEAEDKILSEEHLDFKTFLDDIFGDG